MNEEEKERCVKKESRFRAQGEIEKMFDTVAKGITVSHRAHFPIE